MSSRRSVRQLLVAVLLGVLVGGGLLAVTPAGAEVSNAVATNWKKIWKKNLKPLADKRYYTKSASDTKYQPKGSYETAGSGYSKAESDAKYAGAGSSYSKAESDAKYAPYPKTIRGSYFVWDYATAGGQLAADAISFGFEFPVAPTVEIVPPAGPPTANCAGTVAAPKAAPGYVCLYQVLNGNNTGLLTIDPAFTGPNTSGKSGLTALIQSTASGAFASTGAWAATSGGAVSAAAAAKPSAADKAKAQELKALLY